MVKFTFPKALKLNYNLNSILHNRVVLYLFLFVAFVEMLYFISSKDYASFSILLIVGFLTSFFNKNMVIVLLLSLLVTNVIKYGTGSRLNEGFEDKNLDSEDSKKDTEEDEEKNSEKDTTKKNGSSKSGEKVDEKYENLKQEYPKFKVVQQEILDGVQKMAPLLEKAEKFIEKFDSYKSAKMKESFSKH